MKRSLLAIFLSVALGMTGFLIGGLVAAEFAIPRDAGFAAGATVAVYGIGFAVIGFSVALILLWKLSDQQLATATAIALVAGIAMVPLIRWRATRRDAGGATPTANAPIVGQDGRPLRPPLPPQGTIDSLRGVVTAHPDSLARFEWKEASADSLGIAVYGRSNSWYLVGLKGGGREWLDERAVGRFIPLEELIVSRLNWLTSAWDHRVRQSPEASTSVESVNVPASDSVEHPANIVQVLRTGGTLWFRVEVLAQSPCEPRGTPRVVATGWIPAWNKEGKPTAWFYSRGC